VLAPTRLGKKLAGADQQAAPASSISTNLKRITSAGRRGEEVNVPTLGRMFLEIPGARAWQEIEAAVACEMRRLEIGELSIMTAGKYEVEQAMRVLAVAARDPDDRAKSFGTIEEWGELDVDVLNLAWHAFGDVRERLDPVALPISAEDMVAIGVAVKKKDAPLLRTFGVVTLSAWLASMVDPPSTSPTPSSPSTDSESESS